MMLWIWTGIVIVATVFEFITAELISIWFTAGGLVALVLAAIGVGLTWQVIVFVAVAFGLLIGLRKICLKFLKNNTESTNTDSIIGKKIKLLSDLTDESTGTAKIGDIVWNVTGKDGFVAVKGDVVEVVEIKGNKLVVAKGEQK